MYVMNTTYRGTSGGTNKGPPTCAAVLPEPCQRSGKTIITNRHTGSATVGGTKQKSAHDVTARGTRNTVLPHTEMTTTTTQNTPTPDNTQTNTCVGRRISLETSVGWKMTRRTAIRAGDGGMENTNTREDTKDTHLPTDNKKKEMWKHGDYTRHHHTEEGMGHGDGVEVWHNG